jgi:uncharacterized paraquat-inducible protein A
MHRAEARTRASDGGGGVIPVSVSTAVFLYLTFALASIFILWVLFERGASSEKFTFDRSEIWHCSICTYTYVDSTHDTISQCPRCRSFNKKAEEST